LTPFILGLILFFAIHSVSIINKSWRDQMIEKLGVGPWKGLYAVVSLVGFVLLVWGYDLARQGSTVIYFSPGWFRHLTMLLMLPVFPLLLATYCPGRIKSFVRHPMLVATILWAVAHLLVNGRLADLLLFGGFFLWAFLELISMNWRSQRPVPGAPAAKFNDLIALVVGLALYSLFVVWLHKQLIGVALF